MVNPPRSAYLHIPFCHRRCFYCDFAVVPLGDRANGIYGPGSSSIQSYLKLLHREIEFTPKCVPLSTIYIGGGTPSLLAPYQIGDLLDHLINHFGIVSGAELTLEVDPASFTKEILDEYIHVGINRFSLGGQSFDNQVLEKLGRRHRSRDLIDACNFLSDRFHSGMISSWSLDLINNCPGQSLISWQKELHQAITSSAPHVSIYDLSIEPGTVFEWRLKRGELLLPEEELTLKSNDLTNSMLIDEGFSRYEISNYSLPGHNSRHNRVYWSGAGWWAFGLGSTSAPWGERYARPRTREAYANWIESQEILGVDQSLQSSSAKPIPFDEQLMVGLRRREGIDLSIISLEYGWEEKEFQTHFNSLLVCWEDFIQKGWVKRRGFRFQLSDPEGMRMSNQILVEMMVWWESLPNDDVLLPTF